MCCLRRHIQKNKGRLRSLEEELNSLHRSIQQTCGSRRQGITLLRRKIEVQNDKVLSARQRFFAARKARAALLCYTCAGAPVGKPLCAGQVPGSGDVTSLSMHRCLQPAQSNSLWNSPVTATK